MIHLIDDDPAVRDSMRALLECYGMEVREYASADEFLDGEKKERGCLLVDVHMPGISGVDLLEQIRARGSTLPVVVISGRSDPALKERAIKAGASAFLEKPVNDALLMAELDEALGSRAS